MSSYEDMSSYLTADAVCEIFDEQEEEEVESQSQATCMLSVQISSVTVADEDDHPVLKLQVPRKKRTPRISIGEPSDLIAFSSFKNKYSFLGTQQNYQQGGTVNDNISRHKRLYRESLLKKPMEQVETSKKKVDGNFGKYVLPDLNQVWDPELEEGMSLDEYLKFENLTLEISAAKKKNEASTSCSTRNTIKTIGNTKRKGPFVRSKHAAPVETEEHKLPAEVREKMEESGALDGEPVLVIERVLNQTDLSKCHNRLAIPVKQVIERNRNFLTEEEVNILRVERKNSITEDDRREESISKKRKTSNGKGCIVSDIIMPSLNKEEITLRRWEMAKKESRSGQACEIYVLSGNWNNLKDKEQKMCLELRPDMVLQVWAYRVNGRIGFALVNLGYLQNQQYRQNIVEQNGNTTTTRSDSSQQEQEEDDGRQ